MASAQLLHEWLSDQPVFLAQEDLLHLLHHQNCNYFISFLTFLFLPQCLNINANSHKHALVSDGLRHVHPGQTFKDIAHPEVVSLVDVFGLKLREGEGKRPLCHKDSPFGCCSRTHVVYDNLSLVSLIPSALHGSLDSGD